MPPRPSRLGLTRDVTSVISFCVTLAAPCAAQGTGPSSSDPHRHAIVVSADAGALPAVFSDPRCGDVGNSRLPEVGIGASLITRPTSTFFLAGEVRASAAVDALGCLALVPAPVEIAPGIWETRSGFRAAPGTPQNPLVRNLLRVGLETSPSLHAFARATVGGGFIWSRRPAPMATASIALSAANAGKRIFFELEHDIAWVRETETRSRFLQDSTGRTPLPDIVVTRSNRPTWTTGRLGLEMPLR